jgi:peptidoglycan/xylan/chitin deacetylase (PgdA/CDA1 family)
MRIVRKQIDRTVRWARRRVRRPHEPHGLVLLYHRVASAAADPWNLCVAPARFESQIRALREYCDIVPLVELRDRLRPGRRSRPVVAITFDDGYLDNLVVARPILERHAAPATVFVITGFVGRREKFWWDRLTDATLAADALPTKLGLQSETGHFDCDDTGLALAGARGRRSRRRLHDQLWEWLCDQAAPARSSALETLQQWSGQVATPDPTGRPMTADELRELAGGGLVDLGAHTATHPRLSRLTSAEKRTQIEGSRSDCRSVLGRDPMCFSYPNGDCDAESVEIVRKAGFSVACDSRQDLAWSTDDQYRVPRISVRDESGEALLRRLRWFWLA